MTSTPNLDRTDTIFGLVSKIIAGTVFTSFVLGLSYSDGWHRGFGLLRANSISQEFLSLLGFILSTSLLTEIIHIILGLFLEWKFWVNTAGIIFFYLVLTRTCSITEEQKNHWIYSKGLKILFAFMFSFMAVVEASKLGEKNAKKRLAELLEAGCTYKTNGWSTCHSVVVNDKVILSGYLVRRVGQEVSIVDLKKKELQIFTVPDNARIKRAYSMEVLD